MSGAASGSMREAVVHAAWPTWFRIISMASYLLARGSPMPIGGVSSERTWQSSHWTS